jgi:uncharacterized protein HemX
MRKVLASLALSCALVAALGVAASACEWQKQQAKASDSSAQTAQQQPASAEN